MRAIEKPKMATAEISDDGRYGKFVWEPLERGYGITLGNSLRRVLLSSLPGAAVTAVKIDGVLHEFSTIPGVREDVTDIILNIKELCLKLYVDEPKVLRLEVNGQRDVTAADIQEDADVEILNPGLGSLDGRQRSPGRSDCESSRHHGHVFETVPDFPQRQRDCGSGRTARGSG